MSSLLCVSVFLSLTFPLFSVCGGIGCRRTLPPRLPHALSLARSAHGIPRRTKVVIRAVLFAGEPKHRQMARTVWVKNTIKNRINRIECDCREPTQVAPSRPGSPTGRKIDDREEGGEYDDLEGADGDRLGDTWRAVSAQLKRENWSALEMADSYSGYSRSRVRSASSTSSASGGTVVQFRSPTRSAGGSVRSRSAVPGRRAGEENWKEISDISEVAEEIGEEHWDMVEAAGIK